MQLIRRDFSANFDIYRHSPFRAGSRSDSCGLMNLHDADRSPNVHCDHDSADSSNDCNTFA